LDLLLSWVKFARLRVRVKILKHAYPPLIPGTVLPALLRLALALAFALQVLFFLLTLCFALRLSLALTGLRV